MRSIIDESNNLDRLKALFAYLINSERNSKKNLIPFIKKRHESEIKRVCFELFIDEETLQFFPSFLIQKLSKRKKKKKDFCCWQKWKRWRRKLKAIDMCL